MHVRVEMDRKADHRSFPDKTCQRLKGGNADEDFTNSKVNSDTVNNNNKIKIQMKGILLALIL